MYCDNCNGEGKYERRDFPGLFDYCWKCGGSGRIKSKTFVDPPEGWKYGFPKELDRELHNRQDLVNFLVDHGYPQGMCEDVYLDRTRYIESKDGNII